MNDFTLAFDNKNVFVTGGGRGIGEAISLSFAAAGANVIIGSNLNLKRAEKTAGYIRSWFKKSKVDVLQADIRDRAAVREGLYNVLGDSSLHVLVNNAGVNIPGEFETLLQADLRTVIDVNLIGTFFATQAALSFLTAGSAIVNIGSISAALGGPTSVHYAASKAGIEAFTRGLAKQLAPTIRVNCVAPGYIQTDMLTQSQDNEAVKKAMEATPLLRRGEPYEVANAVLWLSSELASYITGQTLRVDGGLVM